MNETKETFSTRIELLAAFLLVKGLKMERIEIIPEKYFLESFFHFPKKEAEELLRNPYNMVNFTNLKLEHDILYIEASKARDEFRKLSGGEV